MSKPTNLELLGAMVAFSISVAEQRPVLRGLLERASEEVDDPSLLEGDQYRLWMQAGEPNFSVAYGNSIDEEVTK